METQSSLRSVEVSTNGGAPTTEGVVRAAGLCKRYGEGSTAVDALRDVDIVFERGTFTAIMGPSGSGKSTLLHILAGLEHPTAGRVEVAGRDLAKLSDRQLTLMRRDQVGFVFQTYNLLPVLSAEENITLPLDIGGSSPDRAWLDTLIDAMGISHRRNHLPDEMSGGEQQRVAVARALIGRPAVVFADEPTGNLDSVSSQEILSLLRRAVDDFGQTIIMVTHDPRAAAIADRIVFIADGAIVDDRTGMSVEDILDRLKALA
jgi:putative ABC transport system ATP-binding protein